MAEIDGGLHGAGARDGRETVKVCFPGEVVGAIGDDASHEFDAQHGEIKCGVVCHPLVADGHVLKEGGDGFADGNSLGVDDGSRDAMDAGGFLWNEHFVGNADIKVSSAQPFSPIQVHDDIGEL